MYLRIFAANCAADFSRRFVGAFMSGYTKSSSVMEKQAEADLKIKRILIDLSGTLHVEDTPIPNCVDALKRLRDYKVEIRFITNTSKESKRILYERLKRMGFELEPDEIFSTLSAAELYIRNNELKPLLLVAPDAMEHFEQFKLSSNDVPNVVVIGLAPTELNYDNMNAAFRCVMNGAKIIALNTGRYYKSSGGLSIGAGCFVKGLEYSTGSKAILIGKPSSEFFKTVLENHKAEETIMIGDDAIDDIEGAQAIGMRGFLVKTGKYLEGDENKLSTPPRGVHESFAQVVHSISQYLEK